MKDVPQTTCPFCGTPLTYDAVSMTTFCERCVERVLHANGEKINPTPQTVLAEAAALVDGDRQASYDHPSKNYGRMAKVWSVILGHDVTPEQVVLCMIATKLVREAHSHKRDNIVDLAGYCRVHEMLSEKEA